MTKCTQYSQQSLCLDRNIGSHACMIVIMTSQSIKKHFVIINNIHLDIDCGQALNVYLFSCHSNSIWSAQPGYKTIAYK